MLIELDVGVLREGFEQGALDFAAGEVRSVYNATSRMSAFTAQRQLALLFGETRTPGHQLAYSLRAGAHQVLDRTLVTKARTGAECIAHMQIEIVVAAKHCGDSALGKV